MSIDAETNESEESCMQYDENACSQMEPAKPDNEIKDQDNGNACKVKTDLLEYMIRNDGSVLCKFCGDILQSRTHWYRHKYKVHAIPAVNPPKLYQCEECLVFFKSKKGYIGHLANKHSEVLADSRPVLTNSQEEALDIQAQSQTQTEIRDDSDPELAIPKTSVPNYQSIDKQATKTLETKRHCRNTRDHEKQADCQERRNREEKLVTDIIDRVRRECEAQGSGGPARRSYSRRSYSRRTTALLT